MNYSSSTSETRSGSHRIAQAFGYLVSTGLALAGLGVGAIAGMFALASFQGVTLGCSDGTLSPDPSAGFTSLGVAAAAICIGFGLAAAIARGVRT